MKDLSEHIKLLKKVDKTNKPVTFVSDGNKDRINVSYYFSDESEVHYIEVLFGKYCNGPPGFVHGGAISSVLDEAMGAIAWMNGYKVMTAKLEVKFLNPIPLNEKIYGKISLKSFRDKIVNMTGELVSTNEEITFAKSIGIFIIVDFTKFKMNRQMLDVISKISLTTKKK